MRLQGTVFAVYKSKGITSHDVVARLRRAAGRGVKVGHAGTLDPLAEGVLVVGVGREATKRLGSEVRKEKEYEAIIRLGYTSTTDDEEGEKSEQKTNMPPTQEQVVNSVKRFMGHISQRPPLYSAIKVSGKEAYKYARSGRSVILKERTVDIMELEIISYAWPFLALRVVTGPGVYIRALARDIGERLGVGGYLTSLKRTRVGSFREQDALSTEEAERLLLSGDEM